MNSLQLRDAPRAISVHCTENELVVSLSDARVLSVPLAWFPRLAHAQPHELVEYELLGDGDGIHWPTIDEDISVASLLAGRPSVEFGTVLA